MKRIAVICLAMVLLVSFGVVIGCDESNVEVTAGKYVNQDDAREYVEIKADGTCYSRNFKVIEGQEYMGELTGTWKVKGNRIIYYFEDESGNSQAAGGTVEGNIISDPDGNVWVLE